MKFWKKILFAGLLAFTFGSVQGSYAEHRLKVGTLTRGEHKWVVLGVPPHPGAPTADLNFAALGFQGDGMDHLDPKFLLEIEDEEVQTVRSFELENLSQKEIRRSRQEAGLPPILVDVPKAKSNKIKHSLGNIAAAGAKTVGFPISTATILLKTPLKMEENIRKLRGAYLMELINKALPPFHKFPEFNAAISNDPVKAEESLKKLGEALLIRYNPKSNWAGVVAPQQDGRFFDKWRNVQAGLRNSNKADLLLEATKKGLKLILVDTDFAYVMIDSRIEQDDLTRDYLLPWHLVSFVNPKGPVDLVNFIVPGKFGKKLKSLTKRELSLELGGSILPFTHWLVKGINSRVELRALEKEDTTYLSRIQAYGSILALTETQAHDSLAVEGVSYEKLQRAMEMFNFQLHPYRITPGDKSQSEILQEVSSVLAFEEERQSRPLKSPSLEEIRDTKGTLYYRLQNKWIHEGLLQVQDKEVTDSPHHRIARSPAGNFHSAPASELPQRKPVILFLIDGLRPDRFKQAALAGHFKTLKPFFLDRGVEMESYTYRSLTLPSWSSFFSMKKPCMHGIKSNQPTSRVGHRVEDNYEDPRKDVLIAKNRFKNRAFQRIEENTQGEGNVWFPDYFHPDQAIYNYLPIAKGAKVAGLGIIQDLIKHSAEYINGIRTIPEAYDLISAIHLKSLIEKDREGKLRLVMIWFGMVDEASHYNNRELPSIYDDIDSAASLILEAAKAHPVLKNATVFLVSDHGHSGGFGPFDANSTIYQANPEELSPRYISSGPLLSNTAFNLIEFFAGDYIQYPNYSFTVGASHSPEPKYKMKLRKKLLIEPFSYVYPKGRGKANLLVDAAGDSLAQVYVKGDEQWNRLNFYQLTHFNPRGIRSEAKRELNFPKDILEFQVSKSNLMITHEGLKNRILELTDGHPVRLFTLALNDPIAKEGADLLGARKDTLPSTREPVLVVGRGRTAGSFKTGLILTRSDLKGNDFYRYVVVKNFNQSKNGEIDGEISDNPEDDPLHYLGAVLNHPSQFGNWYTDREWIQMSHHHPTPTIIFGLSSMLTWAPKYTSPESPLPQILKRRRLGETPDFLLVAEPGFAFHSDDKLESDHGGYLTEESRNTLFISSMKNDPRFEKHRKVKTPVFNHDAGPTLLDFAGVDLSQEDPSPLIQGKSFKPLLNQWDELDRLSGD